MNNYLTVYGFGLLYGRMSCKHLQSEERRTVNILI